MTRGGYGLRMAGQPDPAPRSRPGDPLSPDDDGSAALEAALADPAFDELPATEDPGRPEDPLHEPGAPHLALDEEQEGDAGDGAAGAGPG